MNDPYKKKLMVTMITDSLHDISNNAALLSLHIAKLVSPNGTKLLIKPEEAADALNRLSTKIASVQLSYRNAWRTAIQLYDEMLKERVDTLTQPVIDPRFEALFTEPEACADGTVKEKATI